MQQRQLLKFALFGAFLLTFTGPTSAQDYPNRTIRLIVGYAAGGSVDIVSRMLAERLSKQLGQQIVVENRPGGATIIASTALTNAAADGYTLMMADIAHGANPALNFNLPYDTEKAFEPVVLVAEFPAVLAVDKGLPVKSAKEFVELAKAKPGQLNYSSSGIGSLNFLASEQLKKETGVDIVHIPYQSGAQAMTALISGNVQMLITTVPPILSSVERVKLLAASGEKRLSTLPDVPTFTESGLPGFKMDLWQGLLAPVGTDQRIIQRLNKELNAVLRSPDIRERLTTLGGNVVGGTSDRFRTYIHDEIEKWRKVVPAAARTK